MRPQKKNVKALLDLKQPQNQKHLNSFLKEIQHLLKVHQYYQKAQMKDDEH